MDVNNRLHVLLYIEHRRQCFFNIIYHMQVIDAYLWSLAEQSNGSLLAAETFISQVVKSNSSTRRTWSKTSFSLVKMILFPINFNGNHWTLLVSIEFSNHIA